jgi:ribose transport system substrate-binding protein
MYPVISIVEAQGISGPDFESEAKDAVSGMLQRHPDINAIWGVWDVTTKGIIEAAKRAGREDHVITTVDLGEDVALDMAKKGLVKGLGEQTVYDAGVTEATVAALAAIGKPVPEFIVMDGITTDRDNLLKVWKRVYHEDPPEELISAFNNTKRMSILKNPQKDLDNRTAIDYNIIE